ncbi:piggyBac transposable element-derived protein 4-like [Aphis craccivora]|uniref:PiggyBac transposable element-derived protein 4-like n=1 Tax=Aphis craccivora TaxID=307492 RepID=A0A6G0ZBH4_APHCR|nr:piggyBac transposable element-derived protein 4-like [Aphis craccivora]
MSEKRFSLLLRAVRFDDIETRNVRKANDKLEPIRSVFDDFVHFVIRKHCTIDEMLEGFRGRCSFRQYIANKPNKYGIKIQALIDSRAFYTSNVEVYVETHPDGDSPSRIVKRLIASKSKTTIYNWNSSIPLTNEGHFEKKQKGNFSGFLETKKREVNSTLSRYRKDVLLTSYIPKKNKNIMISSMHDQGKIDSESGDPKQNQKS